MTRGADGKETVRTFDGKDLADIKPKYPDIAQKLGDVIWSLSLGRGADHEGSHATQAGQPVFGIRYRPVDAALATHLDLAAGSGLLVVSVEPGSQAEAIRRRHRAARPRRLCARRHRIVPVDGHPVIALHVDDPAVATRALRAEGLSLGSGDTSGV